KRLSSALFVSTVQNPINNDQNAILLRPQNSWLTSANQNGLILELPAKRSANEKLHPINMNCITSTDKLLTVTNERQLPIRHTSQDTNKPNNANVSLTTTNPLWPYTCWFTGNPNQDNALPVLVLDNLTRGTLSNQPVIPFTPSVDNNPLLLGLSNIDLTKG
ncbi:unnamed protein product, partial [Trichobilharzia regenti]